MVKSIPSLGFYGNGHEQRRRRMSDENETPNKRHANNKPSQIASPNNTRETFYSDIHCDVLSDRESENAKHKRDKYTYDGHVNRNKSGYSQYKRSLDISEESTVNRENRIPSESKRTDKFHIEFNFLYDNDEQMSFGSNQMHSLDDDPNEISSKSYYVTPVKRSKQNSIQWNGENSRKRKKRIPLNDTERRNFMTESPSDRVRFREWNNDMSEVKEYISYSNDPRVNFTDQMKSVTKSHANRDTNDKIMKTIEYDIIYDRNWPLPLRNLVNTCYVNSIVQSIFSFPFFLNYLIQCSEHVPSKDSLKMTQTLINFYNTYDGLRNNDNYSMSGVEENIKNLKECVGDKLPNFKNNYQEDAAEFFETIMDMIQDEFDYVYGITINNPINEYFNMRFSKTLLCLNKCNLSKIETECYRTVHLSMPLGLTHNYSLHDAVRDYFNDESRITDCESCGAKEKVLSTQIMKLPNILFMQLARYSGNDKRDDSVIVPYQLYIPSEFSYSPFESTPLGQTPVPSPEMSNSSEEIKKMYSVLRKILSDGTGNKNTKNGDIPIQSDDNLIENDAIPIRNGNYERIEENGNIPQINGTINGFSPIINDKSEESEPNGGLMHLFNDSVASQESSICEWNCETLLFKDNSGIIKTPQNDENVPFGFVTLNNNNDSMNKYPNEEYPNEEYPNEEYRLVSVVCYSGHSLSRGHYYCYVRNIETQQWFYCNDTEIIEIELENVLQRCQNTGYLFFYVRHKKL